MRPQILLSVRFRKFSFEECFQLLQEAESDGVELLPPIQYLYKPLTPFVQLSQKYQVPILSIHTPIYLMPFAPKTVFERMLIISDAFPHAKTYVVHLSSFLNHFSSNMNNIKIFLEMAKKRNVTICFESNPIFYFLQTYPKVTYDPHRFAKFCIQNNLPMVFDTSHISSVGGDILDFYESYYKYIRVIHLSDFKNMQEHLPLGQGSLPLNELMEKIKKKNMAPTITLELNTFPYARNKEGKRKAVIESLHFVKHSLRP